MRTPEHAAAAAKRYREKHPDRTRAATKRWRENHKGYTSPNFRFRVYKDGAFRRGLVFELSINDVNRLCAENCYWCGEAGYGIDRLDNNIGYIEKNVVPCCTMCNYMKRNQSQEEFLQKINKIFIKHDLTRKVEEK